MESTRVSVIFFIEFLRLKNGQILTELLCAEELVSAHESVLNNEKHLKHLLGLIYKENHDFMRYCS